MTNSIDNINEYYEKISKGVFPFISEKRVIVLTRGFYHKQKANYRGISFIYDAMQQRDKALLIGYYYVPKDYLIIPETVDLESKQWLKDLVAEKIANGFEAVNKCPSLKPYEFPRNSIEYELAFKNSKEFKNKLK